MNNKETFKKVFATLFFIGGLLLIFAVVLLIGGNKGFAQPKFQVTVLYRDVGGLIAGAPVRLSGVDVGNVALVDFLPEEIDGRRVQVILNIFTKYRPQLEGRVGRFAIKTEGVLGQKLVEIYLMPEGEQMDLTQPVLGADTVNVEDLAEVFAKAAESFSRTSAELSQIDGQMLSKNFQAAAQSITETSQQLKTVLKEFEYMSLKTKRIMNRVEQKLIDGNLFKVF